ncbi:hypothetical protein OKW41_006146 [Paraburkholderia sp. UCT70]|uniref:hypothetical protein n=1 Tax=Paraburkholderia sp. UCT70 TaxID=2991068 RepID=UPI003D1B9B86
MWHHPKLLCSVMKKMETLPATEHPYQSCPLLGFSIYSVMQVRLLRKLGDQFVQSANQLMSKEPERLFDGEDHLNTYGQFWLWVLGAYEVTRTMKEARSCFSSGASARIAAFNQRLSKVRMPFAKQQHRGKKSMVAGEPAVNTFDFNRRDLVFRIENADFYAKDLVREFNELIDGVEAEDVIRPIHAAFP